MVVINHGGGGRVSRNFESGPIWLRKWSDISVLNFIMTYFGGHIGPVSRPYRTTLKIPGNAAAAAVLDEDAMEADSMIYNDHFYCKEIGFLYNYVWSEILGDARARPSIFQLVHLSIY